MDEHRAEVSMVADRGTEMQAPFRFRVDHHRVGPAELRMDALTGGHALHLAAALCTFNNITRLARERGIDIDHAFVHVDGDFLEDGRSSGVHVSSTVVGSASREDLRRLALDAAAESTILEVLRTPTAVTINEPNVEAT